jgi:tetratricopeptide (TPR) repeat protein
MSKKINHQDPEESVEIALSKTEQFIQKHKNTAIYSVIAIIGLSAAIFAYQNLYRKPLKEEAVAQTFVAEQYFRADSFELALNGDGNALGFLQVKEKFGSAAPKSLDFYIGVSQLNLENYEDAINSLKRYKTNDPIFQARALCNIGDAYVGLNNLKEAISYYSRAASSSDNIFAATYMQKAALLHEELGNYDEAIKIYENIKVKYPQTLEGFEADKYIARIQINQ